VTLASGSSANTSGLLVTGTSLHTPAFQLDENTMLVRVSNVMLLGPVHEIDLAVRDVSPRPAGRDRAAAETNGKLAKTLKATARCLAICASLTLLPNGTAASGRGAELRFAGLFDRSAQNLETVANCTHSLRTHPSDAFQTGLVPECTHNLLAEW